jgi:hypothetical protein
MSDFYVTDICTSDLCPFFNFSCGRPILTFSNHQSPMTSLMYSLTLTNKIWEFGKDTDLRIPLNQTVIWDNDVSGEKTGWFWIRIMCPSGVTTCGLLFQWANTINIQLSMLVYYNCFSVNPSLLVIKGTNIYHRLRSASDLKSPSTDIIISNHGLI